VARLAGPGQINSLAQTLIKLTAPGVPDIYQGNEIPDFSLVDPDNRRTVDYPLRQRLLANARELGGREIQKHHGEALPKIWLIQKTLALRAKYPDFFHGSYEPLAGQGERANHVVAFVRGSRALTIVPRFVLELNGDWRDTSLALPAGVWHHEFTGETLAGKIAAGELFKNFPVALLVKAEKP
jgi:(1->4)-alpha-D-glucan 1-alpha-D-glucosylmutase